MQSKILSRLRSKSLRKRYYSSVTIFARLNFTFAIFYVSLSFKNIEINHSIEKLKKKSINTMA